MDSSCAASASPRSTRCSISMPNGVPQSPRWLTRTTRCPSQLQQPHRRVADDRGAQVPDVHLLRHVGRRVVDHHGLRRRRSPARPSRSSAASAATRPASAPSATVRLRKPGPETSAAAQTSSSTARSSTAGGDRRAAAGRAAGPAPARASDWKSARGDRRTSGSTGPPATAANAGASRSDSNLSRSMGTPISLGSVNATDPGDGRAADGPRTSGGDRRLDPPVAGNGSARAGDGSPASPRTDLDVERRSGALGGHAGHTRHASGPTDGGYTRFPARPGCPYAGLTPAATSG